METINHQVLGVAWLKRQNSEYEEECLFVSYSVFDGPPPYQCPERRIKPRTKEGIQDKIERVQKGGWEIFGNSRSLDVAILNHYDKLNKGGDNVYEIVGIASAFKSKNIGRQMAMNNACTIYASQAESLVKGRVVSDMGADADNLTVEFDHFYAAYERAVEKEIRGEIKESFSIIRQNKDGSYEMQSFFLFNEESATNARIKAYENAAKESIAAQKYADIISKYIKERVDPSEEGTPNKEFGKTI